MTRKYTVTVSEAAAPMIEELSRLDDVEAVERVFGNFGSKFTVGDSALDREEPTPSPEANTVEILEITGQQADQYTVEETGKTVAEHNRFWPEDDTVVIGRYPNMNGDKEFAFPESRLTKV